jgi:hypothetical protein
VGVPPWLRLAAGTASAALLVTASGDVVVLACLLAAVAAGRAALGTALACLSLALLYGAANLAAAAGAQAVLGPAAITGPPLHVASVWVGGVAFVAAARTWPAAFPFGLAAGFAAAGPSLTSVAAVGVRLLGAVVGIGLATAVAALTARQPRLRRVQPWISIGAGAAAVALALAA